ncbi:MAG TPA: phosphotransferase family protein [Acidimicrobiales bacterium]|nr:phosphotransferase family protein [Acidimicrobiales bacterium]
MTARDLQSLRTRLQSFVAAQLPAASDVTVLDLAPISSVGNARQAWGFEVQWRDGDDIERVSCVMLVKAEAGQLETHIAPEFNTVRSLWGSGVPVARALWMDATSDAIGNPFFVTERAAGTADMSLLRRPADDPDARAIAIDLANAAALLHQIDWDGLGIADVLPSVTIANAARTQIMYWEELFRRQRLEPLPVAVFAFDWLHDHPPPTGHVSIVHGDLRFGNLLYDGGRISALLDWEMVHLGDPVEDLAWAYRSLWSLEKFLPVDEFLALYCQRTGATVTADHFLFWRLFSEVKHSVISLTAARSFNDGRTRNIRHADRATTVTTYLSRFMEWLP